MSHHVNLNQLVLRQDLATGLAKVGWAAEMPPGRFVHIQTVYESRYCEAITSNPEIFSAYRDACARAQELNAPLISDQMRRYRALGWLPVPLDLQGDKSDTEADEFGSYQSRAQHLLYRLTGNVRAVWALVYKETIRQVHRQQPPREMGDLEYNVWRHFVLNRLGEQAGDIHAGTLAVQESGLWFCPDDTEVPS